MRPWNPDIEKQIDIASQSGYSGFEPWIRDLLAYKQAGGKLSDLKTRLQDAGLEVVGAIGLFHVNDYPQSLLDQKSPTPIVSSQEMVWHRCIGSTVRMHRIGYQGYLSLELFRRKVR